MNEVFVTGRRFDNEDLITNTSTEQEIVEETVGILYDIYKKKATIDPNVPELLVDKHVYYLRRLLFYVPLSCTQTLDCSRPWLCYWLIHSLSLLGYELEDQEKTAVVKFLNNCQHEDGGFGGGPGQIPHIASTFASVNALCCIGTKEAYSIVDRKKLRQFLLSLKCPWGAFRLQDGGETDLRGVYCAAAIACITNIVSDELFHNTPQWIAKCQSYEGGFASEPGMEAHGGYSFCAIATLTLLNSVRVCDVQRLCRWAAMRQMSFEGGFQGRTNKLVDSCYSYWQGAIIPIVQQLQGYGSELFDDWLFNRQTLQQYVLMCCQNPGGGFVDQPKNKETKLSSSVPEKQPISISNFEAIVAKYGFKHASKELTRNSDPYHTCYALSGLSLSQYSPNMKPGVVIGTSSNLLMPLNPLFNIEISRCNEAVEYFLSVQDV